MDDDTPNTQPGGALTPPPRPPVTAIAASTPPSPSRREASRMPLPRNLREAVDAVLDRIDMVADRIADAAGLR